MVTHFRISLVARSRVGVEVAQVKRSRSQAKTGNTKSQRKANGALTLLVNLGMGVPARKADTFGYPFQLTHMYVYIHIYIYIYIYI